MPDLVLTERQQRALHCLLATDPCPGSPLPSVAVLQQLAVLVPADDVITVLQDGERRIAQVVGLPRHVELEVDLMAVKDRPFYLGVMHWSRNPAAAAACHALDGGVDGVAVGFRNGTDSIVQFAFGRTRSVFTDRDLAMLRMLTPLLARLVRERPTPALPAGLTVQERRVLSHVAAGRSNGQIAEDLFISPATVRKHLENAYRKLGVTGRVAAVARLQGRDLPDLDLRERIARLD